MLVPRGIACLAFNRRGHDMVTSVGSRGGTSRYASGGSFQFNSEGIEDNRLASDWLASRGFKNPIVIGHSNGGMLAAKHCADDYGKPRALVMLSAHGGGPQLARAHERRRTFRANRQAELTAQAESMVVQGKGRELMLLPAGGGLSLPKASSTAAGRLRIRSSVPPRYVARPCSCAAPRKTRAYPAENLPPMPPPRARCASFPTATTGTPGMKKEPPS